jgi:lysophospholipase L1-like esterase
MALLLCVAFLAETAHGQTLSLARKGGSEFWIDAVASPEAPFALQASANMHLWVDIQEEMTGPFSSRLNTAGIAGRFFRLTPLPSPPPPIRVVLIGDCTVADGSGWGQGIYDYFKSSAIVVNLAFPWQSTKVFLTSDEKAKMLVIKPDYVLMQFGMMDAQLCGGEPDDRCMTTLPQYADNLKTIVQMIRGFNGVPILVTPTTTRAFDAKGNAIRGWADRAAAMKEVAAEVQAHLIDLNQLITDLYTELGPEASAFITWPTDNIHFSAEGAKVVARLVVNALPDYFGPYLTGIFDPPPTASGEPGAINGGKGTRFQPSTPSPMSLSTNSQKTTFLFLRNAGRP